MSFTFRPGDTATVDEIGGKAYALAALHEADLPVPAWFVLSSRAFEGWRDSSDDKPSLSDEVLHELREALQELCPDGQPVAVRSSALDEDSAGHSFAGQFDSYLFVPHHEVPARVLDVWNSAFSERVLAYRQEHGLEKAIRPPAVLIQRMVNAEVSGVAFGADPVSGRNDLAVVAAVYGLGTSLVSGECDADTFHVNRSGTILYREIASKQQMHCADVGVAEGVSTKDVAPERVNQPALNDEQVKAVAALVRATSHHFGRPQDIEWAIAEGQLYLLQSRPITSLQQLADPDSVLQVWDNSNIAESYNGITTPLTFSFARRAYAEVYRQFCRIMRVSEDAMAEHHDVFERMLGLVRGRIYYNLLNWYRLLALLPGFTFNRRFMEQMMGVREELSPEVLATLGWKNDATRQARWRDGWNLARTVFGLIVNGITLPRRVNDFYARLNTALAIPRAELQQMRADELVAHYHDLERQLLTRWDAPLVNDFLAMIFFGVLRRVCQKWCGAESLANSLVSGSSSVGNSGSNDVSSGMISMEPARRVREMAQTASAHESLVSVLYEGTLPQIRREVAKLPPFHQQYQEYLNRFGDRCLEELKLESATLYDDPMPLLRSVGQLARRLCSDANTKPVVGSSESNKQTRVPESPSGTPATIPVDGLLRRIVFQWILKNARARVRDRENLRFERTRVFGRVRQIFVELGKRLHALNLLDQPRDIFYLQVDEILGFMEGTATTTNLRALVTLRRAEFEGFRSQPAPSDRFTTRGAVYQGNSFQGDSIRQEKDTLQANTGDSENQRSGIGCCAGVVRGPVRIVRDPRTAELKSGEILVAERTDPGWVMLFPAASGLLVERGSLLSHSAIVAREMGLPAIVSLPEVTQWLRDGDLVEMDGSTGVVRRLTPEENPEENDAQ